MKLLDLLGTPSLEKFQLTIELSDDVMQTAANVASALARTADDMLACRLVAGVIRDANGKHGGEPGSFRNTKHGGCRVNAGVLIALRQAREPRLDVRSPVVRMFSWPSSTACTCAVGNDLVFVALLAPSGSRVAFSGFATHVRAGRDGVGRGV